MGTITEINIERNYGVRPTDNAIYEGMAWGVEKGEPYDLVQFSLKEIDKPYFWRTTLCFPCGMSEQKFHKHARPLVNTWVHCQLVDVNTKGRYIWGMII